MWLSDLFNPERERRFFDILSHLAALAREAAEKLAAYVNGGDPSSPSQIAALRRQGRAGLQQLIDAIRNTFVTPLDRTDLYNLGEGLADMLDYLDNAAAEIELFGVAPTDAMRRMCEGLRGAADQICIGVGSLQSKPAQAYASGEAASSAEEAIEDLYRHALAALFEGQDYATIFKTREIYRHLSNSADRADAIGKLIGKIVVKNT
ncbi:MAG TPA: DUF47 family protein [Candidatus Eremiobacteraceae bacterium]|nr:DUF47 family protein [Candidatus Eremiobacteraceae bacterium]